MATDQISALVNQNRLGKLYERIRLLDEGLLREGCIVDNSMLRKRITIMVVIVFAFELTIMLSSYIVLIDYTKWKSLLWLLSCLPTLYNSVDKIWFIVTLLAIKQRFITINNALNDMVEEHAHFKMSSQNNKNFTVNKNKENIAKDVIDIQEDNLNYLYAELSGAAATAASDLVKYKMGRNRIIPVAPVSTSINNFNQLTDKKSREVSKIVYESQLNDIVKVEEKLNHFCKMHDELCEIGKMLNELWSYPILIIMAYGFIIFTAQLYYLYCAQTNQVNFISLRSKGI